MRPDLAALLQDVLGPDYRVERELEAGGMSRVFLATDIRHDRQVVVKVLPPELISDQSAQRFKREIEITVRLQHPHILPVLTSGTWPDGSYYITPFISGESLRARIEREKKLPLDDIVKILGDIGSAVAFAHARGVIHRDIKPGNILFSEGESILADFGIARIVSTAATPITTTGVMLGTPSYMAPEMSTHEGADVYSLGVVACEMLTGALPSRGMSVRDIVAARGAVPGDSRWRVAAMAALIGKAISISPVTRTATAQELIGQLGGVKTRWKRSDVLTGVTVVAAAAIVVAAFSAFHPSRVRLAATKFVVTTTGAPDPDALNAVRAVRDRLSEWRDITVSDAMVGLDSASTRFPSTIKEALVRARSVGARNLILVEARSAADTLNVRATLFDAAGDTVFRERDATYSTTSSRAEQVTALRRLVNHLLRDNDRLPWRSGADRATASLAAWKAFDAANEDIRAWDLADAEQNFRRSLSIDNGLRAHFITG